MLPFANGRFPAGYVWVQAMGRTGSLSEHQKELAAALPRIACRKCLSDATVVRKMHSLPAGFGCNNAGGVKASNRPRTQAEPGSVTTRPESPVSATIFSMASLPASFT